MCFLLFLILLFFLLFLLEFSSSSFSLLLPLLFLYELILLCQLHFDSFTFLTFFHDIFNIFFLHFLFLAFLEPYWAILGVDVESIYVVEKLSFSMIPPILIFDSDLMFGLFLTFWVSDIIWAILVVGCRVQKLL